MNPLRKQVHKWLNIVNDQSKLLSTFSLLYHNLAFKLKKPIFNLENGALVISVDVDVGNSVLGRVNKGENDRNVHDSLSEYYIGLIEEQNTPLLINLFETFEIPATFALRGQLLNFSNSIIKILLNSSIKFDIASHGYYHREFAKMQRSEAEEELKMISIGMKKFNLTPRSFIFPRNSVFHLDLLEKYSYICYRGLGGFYRDGNYVKKVNGLYDVHPSLYIDRNINIRYLKKIVDIIINKRTLLHIWFHPKDLGYEKNTIENSIAGIFSPFLKYARKKNKEGSLNCETMISIVNKLRNQNDLIDAVQSN